MAQKNGRNKNNNSIIRKTLNQDTIKVEELMQLLGDKCIGPVCLKSGNTTVKLHLKVHGICGHCLMRVFNCDDCHGPNNPSIIIPNVQIMPKICKYSMSGCKSHINTEKHHELSCEFRPIACKIGLGWCKWRGPAGNFKSHVKSQHKQYFASYRDSCPQKLYYNKFKNRWDTVNYMHEVDNNMFILFAHKDRHGRFIQIIKHVPITNAKNVYYFNISFGDANVAFRHSIKAVLYDDAQVNPWEDSPHCMIVPIDELDKFLVPYNGSLKVTFEVVKVVKK